MLQFTLLNRWLDKTPTSRVITRCTQDIRTSKLTTTFHMSACNLDKYDIPSRRTDGSHAEETVGTHHTNTDQAHGNRHLHPSFHPSRTARVHCRGMVRANIHESSIVR